MVERLLPVNGPGLDKIDISGFIGRAGVSRPNARAATVFVNGRAVESPVLTAALRESLSHRAHERGKCPVTFFFLKMSIARPWM